MRIEGGFRGTLPLAGETLYIVTNLSLDMYQTAHLTRMPMRGQQ